METDTPAGQSVAFPRSTPEAQGVPSSAILAFLEEATASIHELHSFMLVRHGNVVAEGWWAPYAADMPHMLFSLSKSFTSTAAGLAVAEGKLFLDDPVLSFFPDDAPAIVSENLAAMRVRHLLSMSTGNEEDTTGYLHADSDGNWARAFLARPVERAPGTHFVYNSGATYMVSAIVQKVTGQRVLDYLRPRLFEPLGIVGATWETCPNGIDVGGWGLNVQTEDIAKFGQLYLQNGVWNGQRLLPEGWVGQATSAQVSNGDDPNNDWNQGYGYQFWRCRHGAYRGDGAFGQFCVVMPEQDAVVAITAGVPDMGAVLNLLWKHLLPVMQTAPLPGDPVAHDRLLRRFAGLAIRVPEGAASSPVAAATSGQVFRFEPNDQEVETITFEFRDEECLLRARRASREEVLRCGTTGRWLRGTTTLSLGPRRHAITAPLPVAASGAWTDQHTYVAKLCFYETPFCPTITCRFDGDALRVEYRVNVAFGPTEAPPLFGKRAR